jgi:hypothetical protein
MNIYQLQEYLVTEITTGHPQELVNNLDEEDTKEALCAMMLIWAGNRNNPTKLSSEISRFVGQLVEQTSKDMPHDDVVLTAEDMRDWHEDNVYQARKEGCL